MNQRVTTPAPASARRAGPFVTLLLIALALEVAQTTATPMFGREAANSPQRGWEATRPYLSFIGPPPLRFQESPPAPDLGGSSPASAPPKLSVKTEPDIIKLPVAEGMVAAVPATPASSEKSEVQAPGNSSTSSVAPPSPPSLLPDDTGRKVRPEDFLPFFQFPGVGAHGGEAGAAPAAPPEPAALPPSTATYQQQ